MERLQNEMFVGKFLRMLPRDGSMMLLEKAMADGRANDAFRAAPTLKGIALNLSLTKLAAACSQLPEALRELSERERSVAQLMALRKTNREIAETLFLSEGTVKQYINRIYSKLQLTGTAQEKRRALTALLQKN